MPTETPRSIAVRKYGSSLLKEEGSLELVVQDIGCCLDGRTALVVVTSAFAGETDRLIDEARRVGGDEASHEKAAHVASGEARAATLLTLALVRSGIRAAALGPREVGIRTAGDPLDASITEVRPLAILEALERADVVVVPGFVGTHADGRVALLGRGGSDLTAIELAAALDARCRLVKDVPGIFSSKDSAGHPCPTGQRLEVISWNDALLHAGKAVQQKAAETALERRQPYEVGLPFGGPATKVAHVTFPRCIHFAEPERRPYRVALLGCGVVGRGVLERLGRFRDRFEVIGVAVRDVEKHAAGGIDRSLLRTDPAALAQEAEVVVEALGGIEPARTIIEQSLALGRHVVTANKAVIAQAGEALGRLAEQHGCTLRYGGAVGGAASCVELIDAVGREGIETIRGVLNGTTNSILESTASGRSRREALERAQAAGFAEADPTRDLTGVDAAEKLTVLTQRAWGQRPERITRTDIRRFPLATLREDWAHGFRWRQVARATRTRAGIEAAVTLQLLALKDPLYELPGAWNGLVVTTARGHEYTAFGQGAGRWPTTLAVVRDLLHLPPSPVSARGRATERMNRWWQKGSARPHAPGDEAIVRRSAS